MSRRLPMRSPRRDAGWMWVGPGPNWKAGGFWVRFARLRMGGRTEGDSRGLSGTLGDSQAGNGGFDLLASEGSAKAAKYAKGEFGFVLFVLHDRRVRGGREGTCGVVRGHWGTAARNGGFVLLDCVYGSERSGIGRKSGSRKRARQGRGVWICFFQDAWGRAEAGVFGLFRAFWGWAWGGRGFVLQGRGGVTEPDVFGHGWSDLHGCGRAAGARRLGRRKDWLVVWVIP